MIQVKSRKNKGKLDRTNENIQVWKKSLEESKKVVKSVEKESESKKKQKPSRKINDIEESKQILKKQAKTVLKQSEKRKLEKQKRINNKKKITKQARIHQNRKINQINESRIKRQKAKQSAQMKKIKKKKYERELVKKEKKINQRPIFNPTPLKTKSETSRMKLKKVQIVGMFNTGSNLVAKLINALYHTEIQFEGHTLWWKHSTVSDTFVKDFSHEKNTLFVVVVKNPYWWLHSVHKASYGITMENDDEDLKDISDFIKKKIKVKVPPKNKHIYNDEESCMNFDNLVNYWCTFYGNAIKFLPQDRTIFVRYYDVLHHQQHVIDELSKYLALRKQFTRNKGLLKVTVDKIFNKPSKSHGNPRYGKNALEYYQFKNIPKLFKLDTFGWIEEQINEAVMTHFNYHMI